MNRFLRLCLIAAVCASAGLLPAADWTFDVTYAKDIHAEPYSGRVYVFFTKSDQAPRFGPDWFQPEPFIARDVTDWKPGETLTFSSANATADGVLAFPKSLGELRLAKHRAQAVVRFNPYEREVGTGPGNGYSGVVPLSSTEKSAALVVDKLAAEPEFVETERIKLFRVRSASLSEFQQREVFLQAAVELPASYATSPDKRYPVMFVIPGFGGTHQQHRLLRFFPDEKNSGIEFIRVLLDPSCPRGHHVFADSANNGPYGSALVNEFIPELDRAYRTVAEPRARFLTGHSSGGWSSLWVMISHPVEFAGTWSTAPDPVDFRDFQRIDLYRPGENMYVDGQGAERPIARAAGQPVLWYRKFAAMENVLGYGGQLHSFEAVFSPRGEDGQPRSLWNRETGVIDTAVARTWEPYDIRLILERNWPTLGPKLAGKLHVFMGDQDTFYLDGATKLLKESLAKLGSDAVVEIHPGKDHGTLLTPDLCRRIVREMGQGFSKSTSN